MGPNATLAKESKKKMAIEITVPSVGESVSEVTVGKWLKEKGASVSKDEPLVSLETDKVNVEVTAPEAGTLSEVLVKEGDTVSIGALLARVTAGAPQKTQQSATSAKTEKPKSDAPPMAQPASAPEPQPAVSEHSGEAKVMPAAQRLAHETGVRADDVPPSGPGGRVLKEDVQRATEAPVPSPQTPKPPRASADVGALERLVPMTSLRKRVAERLVEAQRTAAILTTFNEVDMTAVMTLRKAHQELFVKRYGVKLGFMSFFVKAAIDALRAYPEVNAEIRQNQILYKDYYDIGVAVGGDKGLVVPVVRRAETLGFAELEQTIGDFGKRAGAGKLKLDELMGGTFTISNGGVYGSLMSTPILNPPQSGILGMHSIVDRPVALQGQVVIRPMMYIALSYDHRIVDGKGAVSFLKRIKECVEAPERMLLEI